MVRLTDRPDSPQTKSNKTTKLASSDKISSFLSLIWPNIKNMCGSGYPTYPIFTYYLKLFFLHFGQTVHLKKKMEGKACISKDFFL